MDNNINYEVSKILKNAEKEMLDLNHPYVGSEHLLLSLLKENEISNITSKYNLTYESFKNELIRVVGNATKKSKVILYTPLLRLIINEYMNVDEDKDIITLFKLVLTSEEGIALRILDSMNIDIDLILDNLNKNNVLDDIGIILNDIVKDKLIGRDNELKQLEEILLRKNKNNPILIGEAGVGKSAIVYELARRIKNNLVSSRLSNYKIISVDMASLLTNTKYRGEFETKLNNIINYIKNNKNIILFIDEIHTIVKSGGGEGSIDAANILKPYLAKDDIKIIGATTVDEYDKYISKDKALTRRFQSVLVNEPSVEETINILKGVKDEYENYHGIKISDELIEYIVTLSNKYIYTSHNPDKSLDVLDTLMSKVSLNEKELLLNKLDNCLNIKDYKQAIKYKNKLINNKINITKKDVNKVVEEIGNIKIIDDNLLKEFKNKLNNIYNIDKDYLYNLIKDNINNNVLGIEFIGNKGTGKSYLIDLICTTFKYHKITLNMNEYKSSISINKLIGSSSGYIGYDDGCIFDQIKYYPFSLIELNNIENADSSVIDLFKSIINDGYITNNKGNIINFNSCIIIMTSSITNNSIGINSNIKNTNLLDNVLIFNNLNINMIKKYLIKNNINIDISKINNVNNYIDLNKIVNDIYINSSDML